VGTVAAPTTAGEWAELQQAFTDCNFGPTEVDQLNSALAGVLLLGRLEFEDGSSGDAAVIKNQDILADLCHVLQVQAPDFCTGLMTYEIEVMKEKLTKHLNVGKCAIARNAVAKALYDRIFRWLVFKINLTLEPEDDKVCED
jgi:myosin-1